MAPCSTSSSILSSFINDCSSPMRRLFRVGDRGGDDSPEWEGRRYRLIAEQVDTDRVCGIQVVIL